MCFQSHRESEWFLSHAASVRVIICASDDKNVSWLVLTIFLSIFFLELLGTFSNICYCLFSMEHLLSSIIPDSTKTLIFSHYFFLLFLQIWILSLFIRSASLLLSLGLCRCHLTPSRGLRSCHCGPQLRKKTSFFITIHRTYCSQFICSSLSCNYHLQVGQGLKISSVHLGPWGFQFSNLSL